MRKAAIAVLVFFIAVPGIIISLNIFKPVAGAALSYGLLLPLVLVIVFVIGLFIRGLRG